MASLTLAQGLLAAHAIAAHTDAVEKMAPRFALAEAGGMRAFVRLALTEKDAVKLHRDGVAPWHICALLGLHKNFPAHITATPEDAAGLILLDLLVDESSFAIAHHSRDIFLDRLKGLPESAIEAGQRFAAPLWDLDYSAQTISALGTVLQHMADLLGVDLPANPPKPNVWHEEEHWAQVLSYTPQDRAPNGFLRSAGFYQFQIPGGGAPIKVYETGILVAGKHLRPRQNVLLTFKGATAGHPGYLARLQDNPVYKMPPPPVDETGVALRVGHRVTLLTHCLEAPQGAHGKVIEIAGDMAMVGFDGIHAPVPCYGPALAVLDTVNAG